MISGILSALTPPSPYAVTLIILGTVLVIFLLWITACVFIAGRTLKMASRPVAHTLEEAREVQMRAENVDFTDFDENWNKQEFELDGLHGKLRGVTVFNPLKGSRNKVAVICHGHTWNRINSIKYGTVFYNLGYSLIMYDHSYFGESEGKFCTLGYYEKHDLSSVIDYARNIFGQDAYVALHGESMGAVTVLSLLGLRSDVDLVVADCPFSDTGMYYREFFEHSFGISSFPIVEFSNVISKRKYGYDFGKCRPIDDVKQSDAPICFIHGSDDKFIFPHHSEDMYDVCKNPLSELNIVSGAKHARSYLKDNAAYVKIVENFVRKVEDKTLYR